jgi:hypothetical protein
MIISNNSEAFHYLISLNLVTFSAFISSILHFSFFPNTVLLFFFCVLYCSCSCIVHVIVLYFVLVVYSVLVLYLFFYCTVSACVASDTTLAEVFPCFFLSCKANARV